MPDLNPRQFFHGTSHDIEGKVLPAKKAGVRVSDQSLGDPGDRSQGDHAFVTEDENYAWVAAGMHHRTGDRPRVYQTGSARNMKPGPWNKEHPDFKYHHGLTGELSAETTEKLNRHHQPEWASPTGFPVRKRIDIMPGHQGTFPGINWNEHKADGKTSDMFYEANHPQDEQVRYGMTRNAGSTEAAFPDAYKENEERTPKPKQSLREIMADRPADPHRGQGKLF